MPGSRAAINLTGVERREVGRGDLLALPGSLAIARRIDARLSVLEEAGRPLRHRDRLLLYHGTAELPVEVVLLEGDELLPGRAGLAQLHLQAPLAAVTLDRFILRTPSPAATIAGGVILDTNPRRHRRRDPAVMAELEARNRSAPRHRLEPELAQHVHGIAARDLALRLGLSQEVIDGLVTDLVRSRAAVALGDRFLSPAAWERIRERIHSVVSAFHRAAPLRSGMPQEELRSRCGIPAALFTAAIARLAGEGLLEQLPAGLVALHGQSPRLSDEDRRRVVDALDELRTTGLSPPPLGDWLRRHGLDADLFAYLVQEGEVIRVSSDTAFARPVYDRAVERLRAHLQHNQAVSVSQARDLLGSSRRYVLPLLEWLDAQKVTRRVGDDRILRG
jgi:selenocysteine-specific elongation factor